jgi:hypothetical protein
MINLLSRVVESLRELWTRALLRFSPAKIQEPIPVEFNVNDDMSKDSELWDSSYKEI